MKNSLVIKLNICSRYTIYDHANLFAMVSCRSCSSTQPNAMSCNATRHVLRSVWLTVWVSEYFVCLQCESNIVEPFTILNRFVVLNMFVSPICGILFSIDQYFFRGVETTKQINDWVRTKPLRHFWVSASRILPTGGPSWIRPNIWRSCQRNPGRTLCFETREIQEINNTSSRPLGAGWLQIYVSYNCVVSRLLC